MHLLNQSLNRLLDFAKLRVLLLPLLLDLVLSLAEGILKAHSLGFKSFLKLFCEALTKARLLLSNGRLRLLRDALDLAYLSHEAVL